MINLYERMLLDPAGIELATSWSPVGPASDWATEAGQKEAKVNSKTAELTHEKLGILYLAC